MNLLRIFAGVIELSGLYSLRNCSPLLWKVLVSFFCHHTLDAIKSFPYFMKRRVERRKAETNIIGFPEIGDEVHLFNQSATNAVTFLVPDADVRAAPGRVTRGAE